MTLLNSSHSQASQMYFFTQHTLNKSDDSGKSGDNIELGDSCESGDNEKSGDSET